MASTNVMAPQSAASPGSTRTAPGARDTGGGLPFCSADDLKGVLADIAASIADADRRHTATLAAMQKRLQQLTSEAHDLGLSLPPEQTETAHRVSDRLDHLAQKIAAAGATRQDDNGSADVWPASGSMSGAVIAVAAPATVPVVDVSVAADPADPWDEKAVTALADLYGQAGGSHHQPPAPDVTFGFEPAHLLDAAAPVEHALPHNSLAALAADTSGTPLADRLWLEARFADIATKIERSLGDLAPGSALTALGQRFDDFERRFDVAMQGVATRGDLGALAAIESNIGELVTHIETAEAQASRLGAIEQQITGISRQLSDENLAELMAATTLSPKDLDHVADALVERLGRRLPSHAGVSEDGVQAGEIRSLIASFVDDQRLNDEHTTTMLDTMQQAMIRLLDRMDQLEQSAPAHRPHAMHAMPAAADFSPVRPSTPVEPPFAIPQADIRAGADVKPTSIRKPVASPPEAPPAETFTSTRPASQESTLTDALRDEPETYSDRLVQSSSYAQQQAQTAPRSREDFVAAARRAMRQAASESPIHTAGAEVGSFTPADDMPRKAAAVAAPSAEKPAARSMRSTLILSLVALLTIGGAVAALSKYRSNREPVTKLERQLVTPETKQREGAGNAMPATGNLTTPTDTPSRPARLPDAVPTRPNAGAAQAQPEPSTAPRPSLRPKPETMVDELSQNMEQPGATTDTASFADASAVGALRGISVQQSSRLPTAEELIRAQRAHRLATMSNQVGQAQPVAQVTPASLIPEFDKSATAAPSPAPLAESAGSARSDLPPATIGPNSLRLAAAKGDASAEFEVGARFAEGKGVTQDFRQAADWYTRAANRGFAIAQYRLATLFERGLGVKADPARAKAWYARAAEQGNVKAMHNLAVMAAGQGQGGPDYGTAVHWFTEAAGRGLADSQYNLAILHESGLGTPRDAKLAYVWLALASRGGDKEAMRRRDAVKKTLDGAGLKAAEDLLAGWTAKPTEIMANEAKAAGEAWKMRHAIQPN
jgi:localization factor PodJL